MTQHIVDIKSKTPNTLTGGVNLKGVEVDNFPLHTAFTLSSRSFLNSGSHPLGAFAFAKYCATLQNVWLFLLVPTTLGITFLSLSFTPFRSRPFPIVTDRSRPFPTIPLHTCGAKLTNISSAPVLLGNPADDITTIVLLLFFIFIIIKSF